MAKGKSYPKSTGGKTTVPAKSAAKPAAVPSKTAAPAGGKGYDGSSKPAGK